MQKLDVSMFSPRMYKRSSHLPQTHHDHMPSRPTAGFSVGIKEILSAVRAYTGRIYMLLPDPCTLQKNEIGPRKIEMILFSFVLSCQKDHFLSAEQVRELFDNLPAHFKTAGPYSRTDSRQKILRIASENLFHHGYSFPRNICLGPSPCAMGNGDGLMPGILNEKRCAVCKVEYDRHSRFIRHQTVAVFYGCFLRRRPASSIFLSYLFQMRTMYLPAGNDLLRIDSDCRKKPGTVLQNRRCLVPCRKTHIQRIERRSAHPAEPCRYCRRQMICICKKAEFPITDPAIVFDCKQLLSPLFRNLFPCGSFSSIIIETGRSRSRD